MEMYFMVKQFNMSLRDLDPDGLVRHEDLIGIRQIEQWYIQRANKDSARQRARSRSKRHR